MDIPALTLELNTDPEALAYSGKSAQEVADLLNAPRVTGTTLRRIHPIEILDTIGIAAYQTLVLRKIDPDPAVAGPATVVDAYLNFSAAAAALSDGTLESGLSIAAGSPFRDALLAAGIPDGMADDLLALATVDVVQSRAEQLGLGVIGDGHVESCIGTEWEATD